MTFLVKYWKLLIAIILISSLSLNGYFLTKKPDIQIVNHTIEVPVEVIKIRTEYKTKLVTESIKISSNATLSEKANGYDLLINSDLEINTNPLYITEGKTGEIYIPNILTGDAKLAFLKWDINVNINSKLEYEKKVLPVDIGFGLGNLEPEVGVCIPIPFFKENDIMIGFRGFNIGYIFSITKRTKFRAGLGMDYDKDIFTFIGLKTNIF